MKLLYFAWLRTKIGVSQEEVAPPEEVRDVASSSAGSRPAVPTSPMP